MAKYLVNEPIMRFKQGEILTQEELELSDDNLKIWLSKSHISLVESIDEKKEKNTISSEIEEKEKISYPIIPEEEKKSWKDNKKRGR